MAETHEEMLARMEKMRQARSKPIETTATQIDEARRDHPMLELDTETNSVRVAEIDAIEHSCQVTLDFVGSLDAGWKQRIAIMRESRSFNARQALGAMCGYVLDRSLHLEIPSHPFFEPGNNPMAEKQCELAGCGVTFTPAQPGQRFHSNECGFAYLRKAG